jgi:hypothetical protein
MNGPSVSQEPDAQAVDTISRVRGVDAEAGRLLSELPESLVVHLSKMFHSPKLLSIAVLAVVHQDAIRLLAMKHKVPVRWVQRAATSCLRALRQKQVELWRPKTTPTAKSATKPTT